MGILLLVFFCFVSFTLSIDLTGVSDDQIRSCLLRALKRFHEKSPPLKVAPPRSVQTFSPNVFERILPPDIKFDIMDRFLDFDALVAFRQINRDNSRIPDEFLFRHLANFNPYYLVEDPIVSKLLFAVISKHFVKSKNLQSAHIYDELQLLILKFTVRKLNFEAIPKRIYFCLIAFINETVHGLNSGISFDQFYVLEDFATKLRQHEMHESLQFFQDNKELFKSVAVCFNDVTVTDLVFLHSKPTKEEIRTHFAFDSSYLYRWLNSMRNMPFIVHSLVELFVDEIPIVQLKSLDASTLSKKPFLDRLLLLPDGQEVIKDLFDSSSRFNDRAVFCAAYQERFNVGLPQCFFYSKNVLNEFSVSDMRLIDPSLLNKLYYHSSFNLYMLEMLTIILRFDGLVSDEKIEEILNKSDSLGEFVSL
jgi:hypothetical protein